MESTGPEDSKNVKTSQAYFLKGSSHSDYLPNGRILCVECGGRVIM